MTIYEIYGETEPVFAYTDEEPRPPARRPDRPTLIQQAGRDTTYLLPTLFLAIIAFVVVFTLVTVGVSLAIMWFGLPIMVAGLVAARGFATAERLRLNKLNGSPVPVAPYPAPPESTGRIARLLWPLRQPQYWLDALWTVVGFVTGTLAWCITITWYALVLGGLTYWFWYQFLPQEGNSLAELIGLGNSAFAEIALNTVFGVIGLVTLPWVLRGAAAIHSGPAQLLLNGSASLREEAETERRTREAHQDAEARALRRFERDIHDGPQQRLVRLSMDLGRAKKQLSDDPERAAATIDAALQQARDTVDELRSLTRGIAPPLLVDRGLRVALDEVVNRSDVPVTLHYDIASPLSPATETAIYFTVSEALTNVAKHSLAHKADVVVRERDGIRVDVEIVDDGMGGASESKGTGLRGLRSRVEGVGGLFDVESPQGGPTRLSASLPTR